MPADPVLEDARTFGEADLLELTYDLQKELQRRGERLPAAWAEEAVADLRAGRLTGWAVRPGAGGGEIGFYSRRSRRAFGHVHLLPGSGAVERAERLLGTLAGDEGVGGRPLTVGITGLGAAEEAEVAARWSREPRRSAIVREGLERALEGEGPWTAEPPPAGFSAVPADRIPREGLAALDWRGFEGSRDARLFGGDAVENARMIEDLLGGGLGPVVREASTVLRTDDGRIAGFLLTVELSPRVVLLADLVVDPEFRRLGLGGYLLRSGLRAARGLGHATARLWVTEGNAPARRLYERLGFRGYARALVFLQEGAEELRHPQVAR